jgi:glutathione synthase/RimK-type ligase-like ATP-grasp enzyme
VRPVREPAAPSLSMTGSRELGPNDLLVLSHSSDAHVASVCELLDPSIRHFRFDVDRYPSHLGLDFSIAPERSPQIWARSESGSVELSHVGTVWCRYFSHRWQLLIDDEERLFQTNEAEAGVAGLLHLLGNARWISPFEAMARARSKLYQLKVAAECGLLIPETLVTNDPEAARTFLGKAGDHVYKVLSLPQTPSGLMIHSHLLTEADLASLDGVAVAPCQFQQFVAKHHELRVTFTGTEFFTARIDTVGDSGRVDWRAARVQDVAVEAASLPQQVEAKLMRLLRRLKLRFGAIDMICDQDGQFVFLEVNSYGGWRWLEEPMKSSITASLAEYLTRTCRRENARVGAYA